MKKIINTIQYLFFAALVMVCFTMPASAQTADDLIAIFNPDPLFSEAEFYPGDSVSASIEVGNRSGETKPMAIEAIEVDDPDGFADMLDFEISENSVVLFDDTLSHFFSQGEIYLSDLANNASTTYDLLITFNPSAGEDYQNKILNNFDIIIGFRGEEGGAQGNDPPPGGGGGGGGQPRGLIIFNETELDISTSTVTITWHTNYNSTSRVIYGAESEAHTFDFSSLPNYGYAHSTVEDSNKVTFHTVIIEGLTPGTTYYYRAVSHASPDTVGLSQGFTTLVYEPETGNEEEISGDGREEGDSGETGGEETTGTGGAPTGGEIGNASGGQTSGDTGGEEGGETEYEEETNSEPEVAGTEEVNGEVLGISESCRPFSKLVIFILIILYLILLGINHWKEWKKKLAWPFAILLLAMPIIVIWFCMGLSWWMWILVIFVFISALSAYMASIVTEKQTPTSVWLSIFLLLLLFIIEKCSC